MRRRLSPLVCELERTSCDAVCLRGFQALADRKLLTRAGARYAGAYAPHLYAVLGRLVTLAHRQVTHNQHTCYRERAHWSALPFIAWPLHTGVLCTSLAPSDLVGMVMPETAL